MIVAQRIKQNLFQSTHPSWGATKEYTLRYCHCNISIHAPIVGCDCSMRGSVVVNALFQSTHPSWGATGFLFGIRFSTLRFQSTHPSWGATLLKFMLFSTPLISIHAPIVGCDMANAIELGKAIIFQSTHPSWGATVSTSPTIRSMQFQSTHPSWGATVVVLSINCCDVNFNPRTHRGVRPSVYHTCLISLLVNFNPRTHRGVRLQIHQSM